MTFSKQPLACDPTKLDGLSDRLITSHYENNYGGAVRRLNAIRAEFQSMDWKSAPTYTVNSLKREELIAANSAFLHELYFDTLGTAGPLKPGGLSVAFNRDFGSFDRWRDEFVSIGKALGGGSGWALCSLSARENRLVNQWPPITRRSWGARHRSLPSTCTSMPITWTTVPTRQHTSMHSFGISIGTKRITATPRPSRA